MAGVDDGLQEGMLGIGGGIQSGRFKAGPALSVVRFLKSSLAGFAGFCSDYESNEDAQSATGGPAHSLRICFIQQ